MHDRYCVLENEEEEEEEEEDQHFRQAPTGPFAKKRKKFFFGK